MCIYIFIYLSIYLYIYIYIYPVLVFHRFTTMSHGQIVGERTPPEFPLLRPPAKACGRSKRGDRRRGSVTARVLLSTCLGWLAGQNILKIIASWWCNDHFEKYDFVNGEDDIPYIMENKMFETTKQLGSIALAFLGL